MLTLKEARANFIALELCSLIHWLPFDFNRKTGEIKRKSEVGRTIFTVIFTFILLYEFNFIWTLIKTQLSDTPPPFKHFSNHIIFSIAMGSDIVSAFSYFVTADDIVLVFNELYFKASKEDCCGVVRKRKRTGQDRLPRTFLTLPIIVPLGYVMQVLEDPTRAHVLGNAFGLAYDGPWFKFTLALEIAAVNFVTSTLMFTQFAQLSAFQKIVCIADEEIESLRSEEAPDRERLEKSYQVCKRIHLLCRIQNSAFAVVAFLCKMVGLTVSTLHIFFAIILADVAPPDSIANAVMGVVVIATRLGIYDKAYKVLWGIMELKKEILKNSRRIQSEDARKVLQKAVRGIRHEGIRMGGFYNCERQSTFIAVDFIFSQVVSLLVGFR